MRREFKMANGRSIQPPFRRAMLALAIAGVAATVYGCFSVHVHKDEEQPSPVIVVPNDHPNP
jgi:hypothetical protein